MKHQDNNINKERASKKFIEGRSFRLIVLVVIGFLLYVIWIYRANLYKVAGLGYLGIFIINFISSATVIFPVPGATSVFLGGAIWNPFLVGVFSGIGATFGELFGYFIGFGSRGLLDKQIKGRPWVKTVEKYFKKSGFVTILIFSALPLPIFDVMGILSGTLSYPIGKFFLATLIGRILRNFIFAWTGARVLPIMY